LTRMLNTHILLSVNSSFLSIIHPSLPDLRCYRTTVPTHARLSLSPFPSFPRFPRIPQLSRLQFISSTNFATRVSYQTLRIRLRSLISPSFGLLRLEPSRLHEDPNVDSITLITSSVKRRAPLEVNSQTCNINTCVATHIRS